MSKNNLIALEYLKNEVTTNWRIIITDNGSTSKTEEIRKNLAEKHYEILYIKVNKRGVGLALKTYWLQSNTDIIGYMDLNLAANLKHLKEVYELLNNNKHKIVNGYRLKSGSLVIGISWLRSFTSHLFNIIVRKI